MEWVEDSADGGPSYVVRKIQPYQATKTYRCPGCDQEIVPNTGHVVAWREDQLDDRRHWHSPCWSRRGERMPKVQRSRSAPRY